ncbi:glycosyltransferase [Apibacter muscae]|uniref:glycosyltransferase n=1 Tax=Apibacter muscae TaxID=2509004 RepID=UPI0011AC27D0|nr:glycosyltransferase [Apibacter muscae]TWP23744.1 glycosyltransferase [Apibacter muscae]
MIKVITVVVTYNRLELLKKCIKNLKDQTYKTDILIINNGSTDLTNSWLSELDGVSVINQSNEGGAGGYYRGIKETFNSNYDWIWLMDDDAFPEKNCLSTLIKYNQQADVIAPLVIEGNKINNLHRGRINLDKINFPFFHKPIENSEILSNENNIIPIDFTSFIGMLIRKDIINKIGFPNKDYFMFNDDVEYSLRIKQHQLKIILVKNACIYHKKYSDKTFKLDEYKNNLNISKPSLFKKYKSEDIIPYFFILGFRNSIINILKYGNRKKINIIMIIYHFFKESMKSIFIYKKGIRSVCILYISLMQGLKNIIDNNMLKEFYKDRNL